MTAGECQTKNFNDNEEEDEHAPPPLDESDIELLKTYGVGPYAVRIKNTEEEIQKQQEKVKKLDWDKRVRHGT